MKQNHGLISIIVPVYNVELYVSRCIDSIVTQTYKNLEIILVDDGSTDKSGIICDEYSQKDERICVIHKENGGLSDARNAGIEIARGEYIGFIDSDDWITEDMFELLYNNMCQYDSDISICQFKFATSEQEKIEVSEDVVKVYDKYQAVDAMFIDRIFASQACNKLYKTHLFKNVRFPVGKIYEDQFTIFKPIWASNKIVYTSRQCYYYFMREDSIVHAQFNTKQFDILDAIDMNIEFFKHQYPDVVKYIQYYWLDNYVILLMRAIRNNYDISEFVVKKDIVKRYKKGYISNKKARSIMKLAVWIISVNIHWFRMMLKIVNCFK